MMWFLSSALATADVAILDSGSSCNFGGAVLFSVPSPDAEDVPVDISPAFLYSPNTCGELLAALSLQKSPSGTAVASDSVDVSAGLGALDPDDLDASQAYTFTSTDDFSQTTEVAFTTGTQRSTPAGIVPTVSGFSATWDADTGTVRLDATVSYSGAGGADLVAQWIDGANKTETGSVRTVVGAPGLDDHATWSSLQVLDSAPSEWCLHARTRELDGSWVEGDAVCADVTTDTGACGCESGTSAGALALTTAALFLGRRRR